MADDRYVNRQKHLCGCQTRFDTEAWRSELTRACMYHRAVIDRHPEMRVGPMLASDLAVGRRRRED